MWPWKTWKLIFRRRPPNPPAPRERDFINSYDDQAPIEYERRAVAFFDVLGWKEAVERSEHDARQRHKLLNAVWALAARTKNYVEDETKEYPSQDEVSQFSDSIIISFPYHDARDLMRLLRIVTEFQTSMLQEGLPLRGGVTVGSLYHSGAIAFGPAMNRAYDLENTIAKVPRVIIDRSLDDDVEAVAPMFPKHWMFVVRGDDGYYETDYLARFALSPFLTSLIDRKVANWLVEHADYPRVLQKYTWLHARWEAAKLNVLGASPNRRGSAPS